MRAAARRQQLHQYIDMADDRKIKAIFEYIESKMEPAMEKLYNKWDDPEFIATIERRTKALEDGTDKGYTWEEVKQRARKSVKSK